MKNWNKTKPSRPGYIAMTNGGKPILKKVRSKTNQDTYYTYSNWATNEIEGITFIPVVKEVPDPKKNQVVFYMRKDNVEYVK
jgi:hypothetical protein